MASSSLRASCIFRTRYTCLKSNLLMIRSSTVRLRRIPMKRGPDVFSPKKSPASIPSSLPLVIRVSNEASPELESPSGGMSDVLASYRLGMRNARAAVNTTAQATSLNRNLLSSRNSRSRFATLDRADSSSVVGVSVRRGRGTISGTVSSVGDDIGLLVIIASLPVASS